MKGSGKGLSKIYNSYMHYHLAYNLQEFIFQSKAFYVAKCMRVKQENKQKMSESSYLDDTMMSSLYDVVT